MLHTLQRVALLFYLHKRSNAIFFRNLRLSVQPRTTHDIGASDVRLAPDKSARVRGYSTGARTCAQARSHLDMSAGASIYTQRAERRIGYSRRCSTAREIQAGAPSHTEQRFAAQFVWRPGPDLLKPCWIDCREATTINGLALKSFKIYWKGV